LFELEQIFRILEEALNTTILSHLSKKRSTEPTW